MSEYKKTSKSWSVGDAISIPQYLGIISVAGRFGEGMILAKIGTGMAIGCPAADSWERVANTICCSIYPADLMADLRARGESVTAYIIK
jgi:hypothetical protein